MKHLIILVLAILSLNQKAKALGVMAINPELPDINSQFDFDLPSSPLVIKKTFKNCIHCDLDRQLSYLVFQDTKTMKTLKDITGFSFRQLAAKSTMDSAGETDEEYQKIMKTSSNFYGHHLVEWILEKPIYTVLQKNSSVNCENSGYYVPEECFDLKAKTCQLRKSQTVKMRVLNDRKTNTYTEFQASESKVIREWEISHDKQCSSDNLNNETVKLDY